MKIMRKIPGIFAFIFVSWSFSALAATNTLLYNDNFENYTNQTPLINGTNSWYASDASAIVQTNIVAAGTGVFAAMIPLDVTLSNRYAPPTSTNIWLRMPARIVRYDGPTNVVYDTNAAAVFYFDSNGYCVVRNGTSAWVTVTQTLAGAPATPVAETNFNTIDVYLSYTSKTWRVNVNSVKLTNNISFINTIPTNLTGFNVYNGGVATSYLDNVVMYDADMLPTLSVFPTVVTNEHNYLAAPPSRSFQVRSSGDGRLDYYIVTNGSLTWARMTNNAVGSITNYATNTVWVQYATQFAPPGTYYGSFSALSTNTSRVGQEAQSNFVQLIHYIRGMTVSTNNLDSSRMLGYAANTQTFDIIQTGGGTSDYSIVTNPASASWLSVSPGTGVVSETVRTNTITVSYYTNGLTVGANTATIQVIKIPAPDGVTQFVAVAMTIYSRPAPTTSFTNYSQTIHKGQSPASTNMGVWNAGAAPRPRMNYAVTGNVSWLTVNTSGTILTTETNSVAVTFASSMTNYSGLSNGLLTVTGTDAGPSNSYTPVGQVTVSTQVTVSVLIIPPGTPTGLTATKGTYSDRVSLTWNTTTNLNHFELWRGTNSSVANATRFVANAGTSTSYNDTGIMPGIINYYWVRTINDYGGGGDFSASNTGWIALAGPSGVAASDGDYTNKVAISWTGSYGAQTYEIWRNTIAITSGVSFINVGTVSSSQSTFNDTTAVVGSPDFPYYYWVRSATPYMGTLSDPDTGYRAALLKPSGVSATDGDHSDKVRVIWQAVQNAQTYEVWRNTVDIRSSSTKIGDGITSTGYDDTSVPVQGSLYYYWVRALNFEGESLYSTSDSGWRQLGAPGGVAASDGTYRYHVRITWSPSLNASTYEVWRGGVKLSETADTYYNDFATVVSTVYNYQIKAKSGLGGASAASASDSGRREMASATTVLSVKSDYDGDQRSDLPLYSSTSAVWQVMRSNLGLQGIAFGDPGLVAVSGDYDFDGITDYTLYRSTDGTWFVKLSSIGYNPIISASFGGSGEPASSDYDGDSITDAVVYNEASGLLSVLLSNGGAFNAPVTVSMGGPGWALVSADFDGDGKADPALYSASAGQLIGLLSASVYATVLVPIGGPGIIFHAADYDGDAKADPVTYEEATGLWVAMISSAGYATASIVMGGGDYRPIVADYDGDAKTDPAVYSDSVGNWQIRFSASGYSLVDVPFGSTNYLPVGR